MEQWKEIKQVDGFMISDKGNFKNIKTGKILKQTIGNTGYYTVSIKPYGRNGKCYCFKIHRLIAEAFLDNIENKPYVNHIDGNKLNNNLCNLEWVTHKENMIHAGNNKLLTPCNGEKNGKSVLSHENIKYIREKCIPYDKIFGMNALAKKFNVHHSTIEKIYHRMIWTNI